jgi:hypothetical protein
MATRKKNSASWAACKQAMSKWPRAGVVALVQELYRLNPQNRRFLHARLLQKEGGASPEQAAKEIRKLVSTSAVFNGRFRHADVKRVVDEYAKGSGDAAGVAGLLVGDIEASCSTFSQVGDFEPMVDHVYTSMERLHQTLEKLEPAQARPVAKALAVVASRWSGEFGYGLSDELDGLAAEWQDRLGVNPEVGGNDA